MKKLLLILLFSPVISFSQDVKNREMQMQVNNLQPPPPPPQSGGQKGSTIKTNAFLTSSDFVLLQKPTYEGGWLQALSFGTAKQSMSGLYSYGGNGFSSLDKSQYGLSGFVAKKNNIFSLSYTNVAKDRTTTFTYVKTFKGKWSKGFGVNLSSTKSQVNDSTPPMQTGAPSLMFFVNRTYTSGKFMFTPDLLLSYSSFYRDFGLNKTVSDPTFNALIGTSFGYKLSKRFLILMAYRGNINTNPKFGLMNNISIGNKFNF